MNENFCRTCTFFQYLNGNGYCELKEEHTSETAGYCEACKDWEQQTSEEEQAILDFELT